MAHYRKSRKTYPDGVLAIFDNGGKTTDRYTVVYAPYQADGRDYFPITTMSGAPFWPLGVCQHGELNYRPSVWGTSERVIEFEDLPAECQRAVRQDLEGEA